MREFSKDIYCIEGIGFFYLTFLNVHFSTHDVHLMMLQNSLLTRNLKSGMVLKKTLHMYIDNTNAQLNISFSCK